MNDDRCHRWLSRGAEVLVEQVEKHPDALHCDVLIVGSGYGGAVAAARLAGARPKSGGDPLRVFVLERGNEYLPGEFPATFAELPGHVRFSQQDGQPPRGRPTGLFDLRLGQHVSVLLGNGLGGGSLINAAVMERPTPDAFPAGTWPHDIDAASLEPHYCKALAMLQPETIPHAPAKLDSLLAAGAKMGAYEARTAHVAVAFADSVTPAGVKVSKCLECGDCVSGCNFGAKKSLDVNYLALAQAKGAQIFCGGTVHCIRSLGSSPGYEVKFFLTDPQKARSDARMYCLRAQRVILAAGSLGSTEILLRSRGRGLAMPVPTSADSDVLGSGFSINGDLIAAAYGQKQIAHCGTAEGVAPDQRKVGPTITGLVRTREGAARPLVFEEFGIPAPLYRLLGEVVTTANVLQDRFDADKSRHRPNERIDDPLAVNAAMVDKTLVYGMMGDDGAGGRIKAQDGPQRCDAQVSIDWSKAKNLPLFDQQLARLRNAHEGRGGCGGRVLPNPMWRPLPPLEGLADAVPSGPVITVHPLGGCRMADDPTRGVVDHAGRVFAAGAAGTLLPGLAVLDGSIVPVSLGINPSLTIAALAERALPLLAADWDLELDPAQMSPSHDRPRRRDLRHPQAPAPTRFTLHERMLGRLTIDGNAFDATALIDFAPAAAGGLRKLPRTIEFSRAEITLTDRSDPAKRSLLRCRGSAEVLVRERSDVTTRRSRTFALARRRLGAYARSNELVGSKNLCSLRRLLALCSHLGAVRLIRYTCTVTEAIGDAPLAVGSELHLTKRIVFTDTGNPWRQLSEGQLERTDGCNVELGRMETDLSYFAEQMVPLLRIDSQHDAPNALGDLAELALWIARIVLDIHLLNFLPSLRDLTRSHERLPAEVDGVAPEQLPVPPTTRNGPVRQLSRYRTRAPRAGMRPVLLIHGYGASGSTFTHRTIGPDRKPMPLVSSLMAAGRDVWVLDLRTSIGLPQNKHRAWPFDEVANADIPDAIGEVLRLTGQTEHGKVDVVAHCIGAAMFSVAVLASPHDLHKHIGCVVLSQVAPLVTGSAMNRFRAYVASYLEQYLGMQYFDVHSGPDFVTSLLVNGLLNTFPYPDDDGEAERLRTQPDFANVRHRADAIFGQTMRLSNISDDMLNALDAIYGYASVPGLAQVGHYVSQQVLTDATGQNQQVAFETIAERFGFPLLVLHGRHNRVFDWRGSYRAMALLKQVFDKPLESADPPEIGDQDFVVGAGTPRQLRVLCEYGHQDTLIGQHAHRDVFPHIVDFLDRFAITAPSTGRGDPPLVVRPPWTGPTLGAIRLARENELVCRLALRPPRGHASTLAVAFIPATRDGQGWHFQFDDLTARFVSTTELIEQALEVSLRVTRLAAHQGFAVVTVHTALPLPLGRGAVVQAANDKDSLFLNADVELTPPARETVEGWFARASADVIDQTVVRLDPAWIAAAQPAGQPPQSSLCFAFASCQYPAGLFDTPPAEASYARLVERLDSAATSPRPQLLLLVGDQVYVDETAGLFALPGASAIERSYEVNHRLPAYRRVTRSLPTYPMLDDHEVQDNWEPPDPVPGALDAYVQRQHKLLDGGDMACPPFHYRIAPAGLPIVALDTRSTRDRRVLRCRDGSALLADARIANADASEQLQQTLESQADPWLPKFIVSPAVVFPFQRAAVFGQPAERIALDDWGGFPHSQRKLLAAVRDGPVRNVVLLSGDRHLSSVSSLWLERADGTEIEIISIVASGLYAPWPFANARPDEHWLNGEFMTDGGSLRGRIETPLIAGADGFAVVSLERGQDDVWKIAVTLDLADRRHRAHKRLDGNPAAQWQVW